MGRAPSKGIVNFDESGFITLGDDASVTFVCSGNMVDTARNRRVLIAVAPSLLGDLLARELDRNDLEVVVLDDPLGLGSDLRFDVVVTNGLPPARVEATTVVRLPDRIRGDDIASLLTDDGVERIHIAEIAGVVGMVNELCPRHLT